MGIRARLRQQQERFGEAAQDATAALALDEQDTFARAVRVGVRAALGQMAEAEEDCAHLLEGPEPRISDLRLCARVAHARKDAAAERARVERCLAKAPADTGALLARAWLNQKEGRYGESVTDYDRAILAEPDVPANLNNRAWVEVMMENFAAALSDADRAISLEADHAAYFGTRCFALVGLGELAKARVDCVRALALRPDERIDRGMLSFIDKEYAAARRDWETASADDPSVANELRPWLAKIPRSHIR